MRVLVTGACGYVGSMLVPHLLAAGHKVVAYDNQWFGNGYLPLDNGNLDVFKADIRDLDTFREAANGCEAVIHLACISNDACCQLDEALSTKINFDAFEPMVEAAKEAGVRRFVFASSSSVYGISHAPEVREDHEFLPVTLYNKYKGLCEPILFKHQSDDFVCTVLRPATVCGYAPRMRFDLTVNILTMHAVMKGVITVFGGEQKRPNLHILDMCDAYKAVLTAPARKIAGQAFNVGYANMRVREIAELVKRVVEDEMGTQVAIQTQASQDNRSYHINSDKIRSVLGFEPKRSVEDAVRDICVRFKSGMWKDALTNPWYTNILQYQQKQAA